MKIPYSIQLLETKFEQIFRRGKDKMSDLFIIFRSPEEADFIKELPDKMISDLRLNLRTYEFNKRCTDINQKFVENFNLFHSDIETLVDTNKIRVFFKRDVPKNVILSKRVFNFPNISKISARPFETLKGVAPHLVMTESYTKLEN